MATTVRSFKRRHSTQAFTIVLTATCAARVEAAYTASWQLRAGLTWQHLAVKITRQMPLRRYCVSDALLQYRLHVHKIYPAGKVKHAVRRYLGKTATKKPSNLVFY